MILKLISFNKNTKLKKLSICSWIKIQMCRSSYRVFAFAEYNIMITNFQGRRTRAAGCIDYV